MTTNPLYNAVLATGYITLVASFMFWVGHSVQPSSDTILAPMAILSIFVLSAAVMGYLFLYQPLTLLVEGKQSRALELFLKTLGAFALLTALVVGIALLVH